VLPVAALYRFGFNRAKIKGAKTDKAVRARLFAKHSQADITRC
jgi:hypothetical protein